jgi:hypothetical protein
MLNMLNIDPYQNDTDPEHCNCYHEMYTYGSATLTATVLNQNFPPAYGVSGGPGKLPTNSFMSSAS